MSSVVVVIGEVVGIHIKEEVLTDGKMMCGGRSQLHGVAIMSMLL